MTSTYPIASNQTNWAFPSRADSVSAIPPFRHLLPAWVAKNNMIDWMFHFISIYLCRFDTLLLFSELRSGTSFLLPSCSFGKLFGAPGTDFIRVYTSHFQTTWLVFLVRHSPKRNWRIGVPNLKIPKWQILRGSVWPIETWKPHCIVYYEILWATQPLK